MLRVIVYAVGGILLKGETASAQIDDSQVVKVTRVFIPVTVTDSDGNYISDRAREDFAVFARIRLGTASTIESMGLDVFSIMLFEDPDLVKEIHRRFSEWSLAVVERLNGMDFDFLWAFDDIADTKAPWINPAMYEEFIQPYASVVAQAIRKPWVYHSDGNLFPVLDNVLSLHFKTISCKILKESEHLKTTRTAIQCHTKTSTG